MRGHVDLAYRSSRVVELRMEVRMFDILGRRLVSREFLRRKVILYEGIGFATIIGLTWANEILDIPHLVFGAPQTRINFREALFESGCVAIMAVIVLRLTWTFLAHIKYLEGLVVVCSFCKRVRIAKDTWVPIEQFVRDRAEVEFSHSFCPSCAEEHYGDFLRAQQNGP